VVVADGQVAGLVNTSDLRQALRTDSPGPPTDRAGRAGPLRAVLASR
jgi:hypothetical protein